LGIKLGLGSNTTPPWVDEEIIDSEKKNRKVLENVVKINNLQKENEMLKKQIKLLEDELKKLKQ
jgi:cell shape-determining protein MreC